MMGRALPKPDPEVRITFSGYSQAWRDFDDRLTSLLSQPGITRVCDVGGGANPTIPLSLIERRDLDYTIIDISPQELAKAPSGYNKIQADINAPVHRLDGDYDLIFSKTLAEHAKDAERFHRNVFELLRPGGIAFHFFPTLYALPFVVNRILPEALVSSLLRAVQPGRHDEGTFGKFPAYYDWCRGPTPTQIGRLAYVGFVVREYHGYFGHGYYRRMRPLDVVQSYASQWVIRHPVAHLTSYAQVILERPPG